MAPRKAAGTSGASKKKKTANSSASSLSSSSSERKAKRPRKSAASGSKREVKGRGKTSTRRAKSTASTQSRPHSRVTKAKRVTKATVSKGKKASGKNSPQPPVSLKLQISLNIESKGTSSTDGSTANAVLKEFKHEMKLKGDSAEIANPDGGLVPAVDNAHNDGTGDKGVKDAGDDVDDYGGADDDGYDNAERAVE